MAQTKRHTEEKKVIFELTKTRREKRVGASGDARPPKRRCSKEGKTAKREELKGEKKKIAFQEGAGKGLEEKTRGPRSRI